MLSVNPCLLPLPHHTGSDDTRLLRTHLTALGLAVEIAFARRPAGRCRRGGPECAVRAQWDFRSERVVWAGPVVSSVLQRSACQDTTKHTQAKRTAHAHRGQGDAQRRAAIRWSLASNCCSAATPTHVCARSSATKQAEIQMSRGLAAPQQHKRGTGCLTSFGPRGTNDGFSIRPWMWCPSTAWALQMRSNIVWSKVHFVQASCKLPGQGA